MAHRSLLGVDAIMGAVARLREGRGKVPEPSEMGEAILRLVRLGLLSLDEESRISMHPVVQEVVRGMAKTDQDRRVTREALAAGLCDEADRALGGDDDEGVDLRRAALHQLRPLAAHCKGAVGERLVATIARVEGALGLSE
jgi:hypothetical protein